MGVERVRGSTPGVWDSRECWLERCTNDATNYASVGVQLTLVGQRTEVRCSESQSEVLSTTFRVRHDSWKAEIIVPESWLSA